MLQKTFVCVRIKYNLTKNFKLKHGQMVEWFKAHAWKACDVKASVGSNPILSANLTDDVCLSVFVKGGLWILK